MAFSLLGSTARPPPAPRFSPVSGQLAMAQRDAALRLVFGERLIVNLRDPSTPPILVGRPRPSAEIQVRLERAIFDELSRQELLPSQVPDTDSPMLGRLQPEAPLFPPGTRPAGGEAPFSEFDPSGLSEERRETTSPVAGPPALPRFLDDFLENATFIHRELAEIGLPLGATADEAVQVQELRSNQPRKFGISTAPNFAFELAGV